MAYWALKILLTPLLRVAFRVRCVGRSNVPRSGPVILASNHRSFIDSIFLPMCVRRRVTFVAKAEYFESAKTAWFFRAVGMIPLAREGGSASERALAAARQVLDRGGVLGIYPEGTRSRDGRLYRGHTGVSRLAVDCSAVIVPVAQFGTAAVQPVGAMLPRPGKKVTVMFGEPIRFAPRDASGPPLGPEDFRRMTDKVMEAIAAMSGQEQVGSYAKHDGDRLAAPGSEAEPIPSANRAR
ncbi:MAG: lysophospholipid acyltransferase family protein [Acidimicrobiales bacterium]